MDAIATINQIALTVIAGAYVLLFILQLVLWNKMEKMMQLIQRLEIEVMGALPEVKKRIHKMEANQEHMERIMQTLQVSTHRPKLRDS